MSSTLVAQKTEIKQIIKRDGRTVPYDASKIRNAVAKAAEHIGCDQPLLMKLPVLWRSILTINLEISNRMWKHPGFSSHGY